MSNPGDPTNPSHRSGMLDTLRRVLRPRPVKPGPDVGLAEDVAAIRGFLQGATAFIGILAIIVAVVLAWLGWIGIAGTIDRAVEDKVEGSVDKSIAGYAATFNAQAEIAVQARQTSEVALQRVGDVATQAADSAATALSVHAAILAAAAATPVPPSEWIVGVASLPDLPTSVLEVNRLVRMGFSPVIYHIGDQYVLSIGTFPSPESADTAKLAAQSTLRKSAVTFALQVVCPYPVYQKTGYFACFTEPQSTPAP